MQRPLRVLFGLTWKAGLVVVVIAVALVVNNNYSIRHPSRQEAHARVDRAIETSTAWIVAHHGVFGNPSLMFMVADMARMSHDSRLRDFVSAYRHSRFVTDSSSIFGPVWARMVDSTAEVPLIDASGAPEGEVLEILWDAYAVAPASVLITPGQRANMFSRSKYSWGRRQHQLLAVAMYRYYNGSSPGLDTTLTQLSELVARDEWYDARVNDSYPQRNAFVSAAGRPDLVRARWIDRLLDYQRADGSWSYCWYIWCKGVFEFRLHDPAPDHATVQAAWLLYMLKYRFPSWIDEHYH